MVGLRTALRVLVMDELPAWSESISLLEPAGRPPMPPQRRSGHDTDLEIGTDLEIVTDADGSATP